jgi:ATP-dependent Clp protease ATP-binding subunit ClpA
MLFSQDNVLARYTRDLTSDARAGRLEPIRCRNEEIARIIDILLRHGKNNPALVGPAGVGKTAIAEGLAQRIAAGDVPLSLRGTRLLALDHVSLLAGTTYRGQYEERVRGLVAETSAATDVILFVDELHNLIGQGTAIGVAMDAANMLKPALVRGDFRVVGATTDEEYDRWVRGDPALERRFQKITVRELSADDTLDILRARKERLERHHNVIIADEALIASVRLTDAHPADRHRPDRAIDALDEACAHTHAVAAYTPRTEALILERREALRRRERDEAASDGEHDQRPSASRRPTEEPDADDGEDDALDRFARGSAAALERFGAELEAMFVGTPLTDVKAQNEAGRKVAGGREAVDASPADPRRLAELEAELHQRLVDEGAVVRGPDVARVVSLGVGTPVVWEP